MQPGGGQNRPKIGQITHNSCYDEIIEVVAHDYEVTKLNSVGYPAGHGRIDLDPGLVYEGPPPQGDDELSKLLRLRLASRERLPDERAPYA